VVGVSIIEEPTDPAARVLDDLSREWARKNNGVWGAIGTSVTVDSFAELAAKYGVREVLA
jgi:hypothetical protein